jgi:hypothetical protein
VESIARKEVRGLIGPVESVEISQWFVAEQGYEIREGSIHPRGSGRKRTQPLADPDLFLSFARLGARGAPSDESIRSWVDKYGLLKRKDPDCLYSRFGDGTLNQARITLREFKAEVRRAHDALTLLQQVRNQEYDKLRERIGRQPIYYLNSPAGYPRKDGRSRFATVILDGQEVPVVRVLADGELSDEDTLAAAVRSLEYLVELRMFGAGVMLAFTADFDHPRPLAPSSRGFPAYRPRLTPRCPDLDGALWFQFAALMEDRRPWRNCEGCGHLFIATRPDKRVCKPTCRSKKKRKREKHAAEESDGDLTVT